MPELLIVCAVPGMDQRAYAQHYINEYSYTHLDVDMYFDRTNLAAAQAWCRAECENAMQHGENIVVSNIPAAPPEIDSYLRMAKRHGYTVQIVSPKRED